jgi:hypothetical protein
MAFYLFTCPAANMIGMYYLPLPQVCHETGLSKQGALKGLRRCCELGFAAYDEASEYVFVYEMARQQVGDTCMPPDLRHRGVLNLLNKLTKCPFYNEFLARYRDAYHLDLEPLTEGACKGLVSPLEGTTAPAPAPAPALLNSSEEKARFVPPTPEQVKEFCAAHGLKIDHEYFVDYYRQSGWKIKGGTPMKDWQATARNWNRRERGESPRRKQSTARFVKPQPEISQ